MENVFSPGILTSLPGRYAKALFDLAKEKKQTGGVGSSLTSLVNLIQASSILKQVLNNPTISSKDQTAALVQMCIHLKTPKIFQSFIAQLMKAQRIAHLTQIDKIYQNLMLNEKGQENIEVISAHPLTTAQVHLLQDKLKQVFPRSLKLTLVNDPSVLGGIMVRIGSRVIDATLVTQLNKLASVMKGNT